MPQKGSLWRRDSFSRKSLLHSREWVLQQANVHQGAPYGPQLGTYCKNAEWESGTPCRWVERLVDRASHQPGGINDGDNCEFEIQIGDRRPSSEQERYSTKFTVLGSETDMRS